MARRIHALTGKPLAGRALAAREAAERELQMIFGTAPSLDDMTNKELKALSGSSQDRKNMLRETLDNDVAAFLADGGQIKQIPEGVQVLDFGGAERGSINKPLTPARAGWLTSGGYNRYIS